MDLKCPNDQKITVKKANFGRTNKATCPHTATSNTNCRAHNSLLIVKSACNDRNSCTVEANSNFFGGDPCGGTYKYLQIKYACEEVIGKFTFSRNKVQFNFT